MKVGYSFESLVRKVLAVDDSAVHITGNETINGLKTFAVCPATTAAQGGSGGHLTRRDFVTTELDKKFDKTGGNISGNITATGTIKAAIFEAINAAGSIRTGKTGIDAIHGIISAESTYVMLWRRHDQVDTKAQEFVGIDGNSRLIFRKDSGTGDARYRDLHVYYPGNEPTASAVGAIPASMLPSGTSWDDNFKSKVATFTSGGSLELGYLVDMREQFSTIDYDVRFQISGGSETASGQGTLNIFCKSLSFGPSGGQKLSFRSGITTSDKFIIGMAQGSESGAATRKDYVDTELAKKLNNSGSNTYVGTLQINGGFIVYGSTNTSMALQSGTEGNENTIRFTGRDSKKVERFYVGQGVAGSSDLYFHIPDLGSTVKLTKDYFDSNRPFVCSAVQSTHAASMTRRDFVLEEIHKLKDLSVLKTGSTLTGSLLLTAPDAGIGLHASGHATGLYCGTGDGATQDKTNIQIRTWYGFGITPTAGTSLEKGLNTLWFDARAGKLTIIGDYYAASNKRVFHQGFTPTKAEVGLGNVNNWGASSATNDPSDAKYATTNGVKKAYDLAATRAPSTHNHTAQQSMHDVITSPVGGAGQIGSTALLINVAYNNGNINIGQHIRGSDLRYSNTTGTIQGIAPDGVWKCLGMSSKMDALPANRVTLYIRIA